jgi:hypothetical protein
MERSTSGDVERNLERSGDELEERIGHLDAQIDEAKHEASTRSEDTDTGDEVVGDWEDTDDDAGGEDPSQFDDPDADEEEADEDEG